LKAMSAAPRLRQKAPQARWRGRWRFLLATLALTLLYLAIEQAWLWAALQLGRAGWTYNDPAQTYAAEAAEVAARSREREQALGPQHAGAVFELGLLYGYLSQWLGGYGAQPEDVMRELERPVEPAMQRMKMLGEALGVGAVERLPVRTAADFGQLTRRLEDDAGGVAGRVEQATSPRLRHLFMLGVHVGTEVAALESAKDVMPIPATYLIGKHATLAGTPETLWRPLAKLPPGDGAEARAAYRAAIGSLAEALAAPLPEPRSPH
jgi:hypothetical protein